jgi:GNAT superfamily N-acetyltransferase
MGGYAIRVAVPADLLKICVWIEQEHNDGIDGSFFNNYNLIESGQQSGSLLVLVRGDDSLPLAFCLGDNNIDILAVKADYRGRGLGRQLAQYFIDLARQRDVIGLHGECAPPTSMGFWKSMGYISVPSPSGGDNKNWVACPLPHGRDLPDGARDTIAIALEDTEYQMQPVFQCDAVRVDGRYVLARDYVQYVPQPDRQLEIRCNGDPVFSKKNKYVSEVGGERKWPWLRLRELDAE